MIYKAFLFLILLKLLMKDQLEKKQFTKIKIGTLILKHKTTIHFYLKKFYSRQNS